MTVLPKGNLHNVSSPPSPVGSQSREELPTDRANPSPEEEEHPEATNHNIATKWLEAPRKFQASTQDTEGQH